MFDNYFSKTYQIKRIPFVTITLIIWSVVISILPIFNPILYDILYNKFPTGLKWTWLTSMFVHGQGDLFSMIKHLMGNSLMIIIFGFITEKIFGHSKTFLFISLSFLGSLFYFFNISAFGHGASNVTYGFFPIALFIIYYEVKSHKIRSLFKKPIFFLILLFSLKIIHILFKPFITNTNISGGIVHMIAFAVGMSLCCVWHEDIKKWIRIFDLNENPGQRILRTDIFVFSILSKNFFLTA